MSNIAKEDFAALSANMDWFLFDRVFTSGAAGMRKPDHDFYNYVVKETCLAPGQLVFVDDKQDNMSAAESVGMKGVVFDHLTMDTLQTMFQTPIAKAHEYMCRNAKTFESSTDTGVLISDNFAQLLILDATQNA